MNKLYTIFKLIKVIIGINKFNNANSSYHRAANTLLNEIISPQLFTKASSEMPSNAKSKMRWYMAEFLYTCENIHRLTETHSTIQQKRQYLLSGALGAMCDMAIDDINIQDEKIQLLKRPRPDVEYSDPVEKIYITFYFAFFNSLEEGIKQRCRLYYELLFDAQVQSKRQLTQNLTQQEVDFICKEKGGYSLLFLRSLVPEELNKQEKEAWYELGAYIQYCNDSQDLHKDLLKKMQTFASVRQNLQKIMGDLESQKFIAFSQIKKTRFKRDKLDYFLLILHVMHVGILAKLHVFSALCDFNFTPAKFLTKSRQEVRTKTNIRSLLGYSFSRVLDYQYETVEAPVISKD
jgi:hypothetical protein